MNTPTSLVAGGAGFLGSHLCDKLLEMEHEVYVLDDLSTGSLVNLPKSKHLKFIKHDIINPFPPIVANYIWHLASPASPDDYTKHAVKTLRTNSEGTRRLLDLACATRAKFLYASSSEVYGDPTEHPQNEKYRGNVSCNGPRSMYDEAKRYGEALVVAYNKDLGVDTRIARIFNTYGPRMRIDDGRVVSNFIYAALTNQDFIIYGDGLQTRCFCYVSDMIEGLYKLMYSSLVFPVNLGSDNEIPIYKLADEIMRLTETKSGITRQFKFIDDPQKRKPDLTRARELLKWECTVSREVGLMSVIDDIKGRIMIQGTDNYI